MHLCGINVINDDNHFIYSPPFRRPKDAIQNKGRLQKETREQIKANNGQETEGSMKYKRLGGKKNKLEEAVNVKLVRSNLKRWNGRLDLNTC